MSELTTEARLRAILTEYSGIDGENILAESHLYDDLALDSLEKVEIVMVIEDEFRIEIADSEAEKVQTVNDLINLIDSK